MKKKIYKNVTRMIAALLMFATVITATAMPVEAAKKRGSSAEELLDWLAGGEIDRDEYNYFVADMRYRHMVSQGMDTIYGNAYDMNLKKGDTYSLKFYTLGYYTCDGLDDRSYKDFTVSSSNKSVATVSKKGKITAKKNGVATITVKFLAGNDLDEVGYTRKFKVYVTNDKIKGTPKNINLSSKKTYSLSLSGKNKVKSWKSSDTSVATIDKGGKLKGVGYGTTVISCTDTKGKVYSTLVTASCGSAHKWELVESLPAAAFMTYKDSDGNVVDLNPRRSFTPNCVFAKGFLTIEPTEDMTNACKFGASNGKYWKPHHKIYTYVCKNCGLNKYDYDDEILSEDEGREILKTYANSELFGEGSYGCDGCNGQAIFMSGLIFGDLPVTVHTDFTNLHVGDIIYYPTHYEVIYDVSADRKTFIACGGGGTYGERYWNDPATGFYWAIENSYPNTRSMFVFTRYGSDIEEKYKIKGGYDYDGNYVKFESMNVYNINAPQSTHITCYTTNVPIRYYNQHGEVVYR